MCVSSAGEHDANSRFCNALGKDSHSTPFRKQRENRGDGDGKGGKELILRRKGPSFPTSSSSSPFLFLLSLLSPVCFPNATHYLSAAPLSPKADLFGKRKERGLSSNGQARRDQNGGGGGGESEDDASPIPLPSPYFSHYLHAFEHRGEIGRGGFGRVFLAKNRFDRVLYAVKFVRLSSTKKKRNRKLLREVTSLAPLSHPVRESVCSHLLQFFLFALRSLFLCLPTSKFGLHFSTWYSLLIVP